MMFMVSQVLPLFFSCSLDEGSSSRYDVVDVVNCLCPVHFVRELYFLLQFACHGCGAVMWQHLLALAPRG